MGFLLEFRPYRFLKVLSAVRQDFGVSAQSNAHCELSAVRQDFGVQFDKLTVRAVPEPFDKLKVRPAEGQSNAHCELSENIVVLGCDGAQHCQEPM